MPALGSDFPEPGQSARLHPSPLLLRCSLRTGLRQQSQPRTTYIDYCLPGWLPSRQRSGGQMFWYFLNLARHYIFSHLESLYRSLAVRQRLSHRRH